MASPVRAVTNGRGTGRDPDSSTGTRTAALARYVAAATLARSADASAPLALLLICADPATGFRNGQLVGGLLVTALTVPHLIGPVLARFLDRASDGRRLLVGGMLGYGLLIGVVGLALGRLPTVAVAGLLVLAGACAPLPIGGLSSRLAHLVAPEEKSQRRAQGWDAITYGIGGSCGPAFVGLIATVASPRTALFAVAAEALAAAAMTATLPRLRGVRTAATPSFSTVAVLRTMATSGPLRRITYATMTTSLVLAGLTVVAVRFGPELGAGHASGAILVTAFGVGNLTGSLLVTLRPLRGEPERLTSIWVGVIAGCVVATALAPTFALALAGFAAAGVANAPFFTATLAARSDYAPDGGRAQVFVAVSALKIAAGSVGTASAGALSGLDTRLVLVGGAALVAAAAAATVLERLLSVRRRERRPASS